MVATAFALALALAACGESNTRATRHLAPIPPRTLALMAEKGMSSSDPILVRVLRLVDEGARLVVPAAQMATEPPRCLRREMDKNRFDPYLDGRAVLVQIPSAMKIVLIDYGSAKEAFWTEQEVKRFTHSRLSNIISPTSSVCPKKSTLP